MKFISFELLISKRGLAMDERLNEVARRFACVPHEARIIYGRHLRHALANSLLTCYQSNGMYFPKIKIRLDLAFSLQTQMIRRLISSASCFELSVWKNGTNESAVGQIAESCDDFSYSAFTGLGKGVGFSDGLGKVIIDGQGISKDPRFIGLYIKDRHFVADVGSVKLRDIVYFDRWIDPAFQGSVCIDPYFSLIPVPINLEPSLLTKYLGQYNNLTIDIGYGEGFGYGHIVGKKFNLVTHPK